MGRIHLLENPIMPYAWGSHTAIAELLGRASASPEAEMWMGAHPSSPSLVIADGQKVPLDEWIRRDPEGVLGASTVARFGGQLPFLMKVLAARVPLSIQAHPDAARARVGFQREERLGIPRGDPRRNYRDLGHKPELICALTPFQALCGFRPASSVLDLAGSLGVDSWTRRVAPLAGEECLSSLLFRQLLGAGPKERTALVDDVRRAIGERRTADQEALSWVSRLADLHPLDAGVLAPLILNVVALRPGQAMFLPARTLHAYLEGTGIEIMASSDNVLRGGLTTKHVDTLELFAVLDPLPSPQRPLDGLRRSDTEIVYECPATEFELKVLTIDRKRAHRSGSTGSAQILFCARGAALVRAFEQVIHLDRGQCVLVPASIPGYGIEGDATLFVAAVPAQRS